MTVRKGPLSAGLFNSGRGLADRCNCRSVAAAIEKAVSVERQIRRSAGGDPTAGADAAWAAAATFHATARAIRDPALRRAADTLDRAAWAACGKIPHRTARATGSARPPGSWP